MAKKKSYLTATDLFCGAGGSGQGVEAAGAEVSVALNHWKRAIETYSTNFQNARVECTDLSACDPRRYPSTDLAIMSPECTTHTPAGGNKHKQIKAQLDLYDKGIVDPATERSRATMWDVCRFAEYHDYRTIVVENVIEAKTRWPLFDAWLHAMHVLGYNHRCLYFNSMHFYPTPQSRDRMYVVFWKKGTKAPDLDHKPAAYCIKCAKNIHALQTWKNQDRHFGKFKRSYIYSCPTCAKPVEPYYHASFNCIDWSDIGQRIGDRPKPLSPNTQRRITHGISKYAKQPFIFHTAYSDKARGVVRSVTDPAFTQTTIESQSIIQHPFIINNQQTTGLDCRVKSCMDHLSTINTQHSLAIVHPPLIIKGENSNQMNVGTVMDEMQTQCTRQTMSMVVPPFIVENKGNSNSRSIIDPLATQTTSGYCGVITTEAWNSFIHYNYGQDTLSHITDPLGSATTKDRHSLITYSQPDIEDCYYRMLKPNEIKIAMAFGREYIVTGSGKDQVRQLGNAVTPPVMQWIIGQCLKALA